jgi:hypothetical protein
METHLIFETLFSSYLEYRVMERFQRRSDSEPDESSAHFSNNHSQIPRSLSFLTADFPKDLSKSEVPFNIS